MVNLSGGRRPDPVDLSEIAGRLGARFSAREAELHLPMFGQEYLIGRDGTFLRGQKAPDSHERVIREYLAGSGSRFVQTPWRAIGDFEGGEGAKFREKVELPLAQHIEEFVPRAASLLRSFDGETAASVVGSDLAFVVVALPRIHLRVEMSQENDDFPAEAWILFSNNADAFLRTASLHALGELFKERFLSLLRIY